MPHDAPELKARVAGARRRRTESPEYQAKLAAQQQADRELYDPLKGMSGWEKTASNFGAGMHNLWTGGKQLAGKIGIGTGVSDEEVKEKRQLDERLAGSLPYYAGNALQLAGETVPAE